MVRRFPAFLMCLMILIFVFACTTTPKFNFPQGTRVGIINLLEPYATHQNFTSFATKNFTKTYPGNKGFVNFILRYLYTRMLSLRGR